MGFSVLEIRVFIPSRRHIGVPHCNGAINWAAHVHYFYEA
jgi:hypothetical protein